MVFLAICIFYPKAVDIRGIIKATGIREIIVNQNSMTAGMAADPGMVADPQGPYGYHTDLLARLIQGEAGTEPYLGKVAIGAVVMNRLDSPLFPKTIPGVIFEPDAFESVSNGLIWRVSPAADSYRASYDALSGWDPTGGALFFFNPAKPVSWWIWTRPPITRIGNHLFLR